MQGVNGRHCGNCGYLPEDPEHDPATGRCMKKTSVIMPPDPTINRYRAWMTSGEPWVPLVKTSGGVLPLMPTMPVTSGTFPVADTPKLVSKWNGKCGRCGKGTYTGFLNVEHEGGACAASA